MIKKVLVTVMTSALLISGLAFAGDDQAEPPATEVVAPSEEAPAAEGYAEPQQAPADDAAEEAKSE